MIAGAGLVYAGAHFTIVAIGEISAGLGINQEIIALTCVALGTSLPEVAVSITAARKGNSAMAVGNVLGSNVFNTFMVMGIPAFIGPLTIPQNILDFSLPFMVGVTVIFALICITPRISKWEGWMLVLFYTFFPLHLFQHLMLRTLQPHECPFSCALFSNALNNIPLRTSFNTLICLTFLEILRSSKRHCRRKLELIIVEHKSDDGAVSVTMNANRKLIDISLDPSQFEPMGFGRKLEDPDFW